MEIDRSPQSLSVSNEGVSKVVDQFSITLKKFDNEKLDNLYNHESTKDVQKCKYEYTDVISSVVSAVKRMQNSHDIKNCKDNTVLKEFKRSTFWPVGAIPNESMELCTQQLTDLGINDSTIADADNVEGSGYIIGSIRF
ncbi:hypothetical protein EVAR_28604_1 [Eumeta japonica]|uniref:Uncharacterized protein n=1 Tax=Eumeta variegata TaxID=151549 RepID=A0A4C1UWU6_EUMVA|nr:hypothetical protein EVAR_28604_1 [Eumeta japonica]